MKTQRSMLNPNKLIFIFFYFIPVSLFGQNIYSQKGYSLEIRNTDPDLDQNVRQNLIDTYFTVYPVLARHYNEGTVKEVIFFIDTAYAGVAEAGGNQVRINPKWLKAHPNDFDLVTHEVMHLIQNYPPDAGPWWLVEGIADYVRYVFGVDNTLGGWSLPNYDSSQNFDNSYRITARFLVWLESEVRPGIVKQLDHAMRCKTYNPEIWHELTGLTVNELWENYAKDPTL